MTSEWLILAISLTFCSFDTLRNKFNKTKIKKTALDTNDEAFMYDSGPGVISSEQNILSLGFIMPVPLSTSWGLS